MSDPSTAPPGRNGPWRILVLDPDPADPKWLLATITQPGDVRPGSRSETELDEVAAAWVRARTGAARTLTHLRGALCWRVDGRREDG